jgi:hypothetical protein
MGCGNLAQFRNNLEAVLFNVMNFLLQKMQGTSQLADERLDSRGLPPLSQVIYSSRLVKQEKSGAYILLV